MNGDSGIGGVVVAIIMLGRLREGESGKDEFFGNSSCRRYATDELRM